MGKEEFQFYEQVEHFRTLGAETFHGRSPYFGQFMQFQFSLALNASRLYP